MSDQKHELNYRIRKITNVDQPALEQLNRESWSGLITTHELLEQRHGQINNQDWLEQITNAVATHLANPDVTTFVAELDDHRIIGYAAAQISQQEPHDVGTVSYNAVAPDYRGQGVGTALIEHVMDYLKEKGARILTVVTVESDEPARHIYERLGFQELTSLIYFSKEVDQA